MEMPVKLYNTLLVFLDTAFLMLRSRSRSRSSGRRRHRYQRYRSSSRDRNKDRKRDKDRDGDRDRLSKQSGRSYRSSNRSEHRRKYQLHSLSAIFLLGEPPHLRPPVKTRKESKSPTSKTLIKRYGRRGKKKSMKREWQSSVNGAFP